MTRFLSHLKSNAIACLALFVALGGTSYAAFSLPANSVGTRQLRNGAVTNNKVANGSIAPSKLNGSSITGSIAMWARISPGGTVVASKPRAQTLGWSSVYHAGKVSWLGRGIPAGCFSLATVDGLPAQGFATVATIPRPHPPAYVIVGTFNNLGQYAAEPVNVAVICP
jgi:hypothetical protein